MAESGAPAAGVPAHPNLTDRPTAVLIVDLETRSVVYADPLAGGLAPDVSLPVEVSRWTAAAGLCDGAGAPLAKGPGPLQRIAAGTPVNGERVSAVRASALGGAREPLRVFGTPLTGAPAGLNRRALVMFQPLREEDDGAAAPGAATNGAAQTATSTLLDQAVLASNVAFMISDPNAPDDPLVWVNPAFERTTGYRAEEALGRNCRFLQGPLTDPAAAERIRHGLRGGGVVAETLLNYRADGTAFWNHLVISPIFGPDGRLTHHVGVQNDVTERVEADAARDVALAQAEVAVRRQRAVAAIGAALARFSADPGSLTAALPGFVVSHFWGWCTVVGLDDRGDIADIALAYGARAPDGPDAAPDASLAARDTDLARDVITAFLSGPGRHLLDIARDPKTSWPQHDTIGAADYEKLVERAVVPGTADEHAGRSVLTVPLRVRDSVTALMTLSRPGEDAFADPADRDALLDVAGRAGIALENARLYAAEHEAALTLQRGLLPRLPRLSSFDVAAAYVPATSAQVGGDWFDVLDLPGPWVSVTIGDVMGHDLTAAAVMGQLRSMVRTLAWDGRRPADLVARLDELVRGLEATTLATLFYAMLDDPAEHGGRCTVNYMSAGHLPAMLRHADGRVERLDRALIPPVGVLAPRTAVEGRVDMPPGSALVLFTDGLVERRGGDLDEALTALADLLAGTHPDASAEEIKDIVTDALVSPEHNDDTCLLVITRAE